MDLQEVGGGCEDWMELAQDRNRWRALVSTVMNLWVPKMRGIPLLAAEPVSFSRRTVLHGVSKYTSYVSIPVAARAKAWVWVACFFRDYGFESRWGA